MRRLISAIIIGAALASPASAQVTFMDKQKVFADCVKARLSAAAPTYAKLTADREICNRVVDQRFAGMTEIPRSAPPASSSNPTYEIEVFLLKEELNRELDAINRNYDLRRSGVLP